MLGKVSRFPLVKVLLYEYIFLAMNTWRKLLILCSKQWLGFFILRVPYSICDFIGSYDSKWCVE